MQPSPPSADCHWPNGQAVQPVAASAAPNLPALQATQNESDVAPSSSLKRPLAHIVQVADPAAAHHPGTHATHSEMPDALVAVLARPAGHAVREALLEPDW